MVLDFFFFLGGGNGNCCGEHIFREGGGTKGDKRECSKVHKGRLYLIQNLKGLGKEEENVARRHCLLLLHDSRNQEAAREGRKKKEECWVEFRKKLRQALRGREKLPNDWVREAAREGVSKKVCFLDKGKQTGRPGCGIRKYSKVFKGRGQQRKSGIVREMKKVGRSTGRHGK